MGGVKTTWYEISYIYNFIPIIKRIPSCLVTNLYHCGAKQVWFMPL